MGLRVKTGFTAILARQCWNLKLMQQQFEREARSASRAMGTVPDHLKGAPEDLQRDYRKRQNKIQIRALEAADLVDQCRNDLNRL